MSNLSIIYNNMEETIVTAADTVHELMLRGDLLKYTIDKSKQLEERSLRFQHFLEEEAGSRTVWRRSKRVLYSAWKSTSDTLQRTLVFTLSLLVQFLVLFKAQSKRAIVVLFPTQGLRKRMPRYQRVEEKEPCVEEPLMVVEKNKARRMYCNFPLED